MSCVAAQRWFGASVFLAYLDSEAPGEGGERHTHTLTSMGTTRLLYFVSLEGARLTWFLRQAVGSHSAMRCLGTEERMTESGGERHLERKQKLSVCQCWQLSLSLWRPTPVQRIMPSQMIRNQGEHDSWWIDRVVIYVMRYKGCHDCRCKTGCFIQADQKVRISIKTVRITVPRQQLQSLSLRFFYAGASFDKSHPWKKPC